MTGFLRANKAYLIFGAIILVAALAYGYFGRGIVVNFYESNGDTDLITRHKIVLTDKVTFLVLAAAAVCFLLGQITFSPNKTNLVWAILIFTTILAFVYKLNPNHRIYAHHGFLHTGIVYQILNGQIPPTNPLLAGQTLLYPWGYELIVAVSNKICPVSPFYTFAVMNIMSLAACMILIYAISRLLIKDSTANVLSVLISIFAVTMGNKYLLRLLRHVGISQAYKGIPAFVKFSNVNAAPLGLVFYLLFLYSVIKIFTDKKLWGNIITFFISILGAGFVYPQFFPAIIASTGCLCVVNVFRNTRQERTRYLKKSAWTVTALAIATLVIYFYISSITSGMKEGIEWFNLKQALLNAATYVIICFPVLLIIFLNRKPVYEETNRQVLVSIVTVVVATLSCYLFIHLMWNNEYKFSMLSMVTLGIVAGVAFRLMIGWCCKWVVFILLLLLMFPTFSNICTNLWHLDFLELPYIEKAEYIYSRNSEENELYEWIRSNTTADDVFIDTEPLLPVLAQRPLFIAVDKQVKGHFIQYPGYSVLFRVFLEGMCGYERAMISSRNVIVYTIYDPTQKLNSGQKSDLLATGQNVYVISRSKMVSGIDELGFAEVFRSGGGYFRVYCIKNAGL